MNNLFAQSHSHWVRYDRYEIKTGKDGKRYITPENTAKPDVYNPLKESSEMVLEALNVGMLMMNRSLEDEVEKDLLKNAVSRLSPRERKIVELRYGLKRQDGAEMTQKEVADLMGISQSYISRLEKKIMMRLKKEIVKFE